MLNAVGDSFQVLGAMYGVYAHRSALKQERHLHAHEHTVSTEQHFESLATELLAIAKEADRDVWEQRNNQYSQMLVCAVLMFGVAVGNINEGTYSFDKLTDQHGLEIDSLFSRDGTFVLLGAVAISSLFLCIVTCLLVMGRMSAYMIQRSSNLVDRLAVCTTLAHRISTQALQGEGNLHERIGTKNVQLHNEMSRAIGSHNTNKHAQPNGLSRQTSLESRSSEVASLSRRSDDLPHAGRSSSHVHFEAAPSSPRRHPPHLSLSPSMDESSEPRLDRSATQALLRRATSAPLNFSIFYRDHCQWLHDVIIYSFVLGVVGTWGSLWFLLWNRTSLWSLLS